jgi:hypothetical protein
VGYITSPKSNDNAAKKATYRWTLFQICCPKIQVNSPKSGLSRRGKIKSQEREDLMGSAEQEWESRGGKLSQQLTPSATHAWRFQEEIEQTSGEPAAARDVYQRRSRSRRRGTRSRGAHGKVRTSEMWCSSFCRSPRKRRRELGDRSELRKRSGEN